MLSYLASALRLVAAVTLCAAGVLGTGAVAADIHEQQRTEQAASERPADYPAATPSVCQTAALERTRSQLPALGIHWFWADLDTRGAVGLAYLDTHRVLLDPDLDCQDVPKVAAHEWTHVATAVYYGGQHIPDYLVEGVTDLKTGRVHRVPVHEIIADCGAALFTAAHGYRFTHHPIYDRAGGCAPDILVQTREIMSAAGVPASSLPQWPVPLGPVGAGVA